MGLLGYSYIRTRKEAGGSDTTKSICAACHQTIWYDDRYLQKQDGYRCCHCNSTVLK